MDQTSDQDAEHGHEPQAHHRQQSVCIGGLLGSRKTLQMHRGVDARVSRAKRPGPVHHFPGFARHVAPCIAGSTK